MATLPRVSVLLAAYNAADTVAEALQSIGAQEFRDWELIAVDDGSTDETRSVLLEFARADPRVRVIARDANAGLAACLNLALREARGEYVARMDADDRAVASRFGTQVAFLDRHPDVSILGAGAYEIDESGELIGQLRRAEHHADLQRQIFAENPFIHPTIMARRTAFEALGGYDTRLRRGQDYDLWLRAYPTFRFHNLPEPLIWYRRRRDPTWLDARFSARILWSALLREGALWKAPWLVGRPLVATALALAARRPRRAPHAT
ncbi:MAG: hypothetical protein JWM95_4117 [Gemmatimonadetes bacterium]|nr:hypothetical protein [Gemmatimonadota bacterium]